MSKEGERIWAQQVLDQHRWADAARWDQNPKRGYEERLAHLRRAYPIALEDERGKKTKLKVTPRELAEQHLGLTLYLHGKGFKPVPSLVYDRLVRYKSQKLGRASILTLTTKMACPSFSLPAGPPRLAGTCTAADRKDLIRHEELYICRGCYAVGANYLYVSGQLAQSARMAWVRALLRQSHTALPDALCAVIDNFKTLPVGERTVKLTKKADKKTGEPKISKKFKCDLRYFRIHDSGDMAWAGEHYYQAWCDVAATFSHMRFWAPTRDWTHKRFAEAVARVSRPSNFTLRPSALHFQDPPPTGLPGFDAGSTAAYGHVEGLPGPGDLAHVDCPAYKSDLATCASAGCRSCWDSPEATVCYPAHGTSAKRHVPLLLAGNPPLAALIDDYIEAPSENPEADEPLEAYLFRQGVDPSLISEDEWFDALREYGMDDDEISDYLLGAAEWQPVDDNP